MSDRTFTLDEAQSLVPVLESLLRTAITGKKLMEEVEGELQALGHRIFLNGGTRVDVVPLARRKAERAKAEQRAKDALAEIDSIGVQVKDLDIGLLDPQTAYDVGHRVDRPNADAVMLACGNWTTFAIIDRLESDLGKPVLTTNQVSLWHALKIMGSEPLRGLGVLPREHLGDEA